MSRPGLDGVPPACTPIHAPIGGNTQVIRTRYATITVPEIELEMPATPGGGVLTTVEGLLTRAADDLEMNQEERRASAPEQAAAIDGVVASLRTFACNESTAPFTLVLDDPTGNSQIEGEGGGERIRRERYARTPQQNEELGILAPPPQQGPGGAVVCEASMGGGGTRTVSNVGEVRLGGVGGAMAEAMAEAGREVESLPVDCPSCGAGDSEKAYLTQIPHFGEILIMAFSCSTCGYRSTEVKPGGSSEGGGCRIRLNVSSDE